ncbi:hypothetical protein [Bdellovibrio sp. HCB337]|uniref:hypothetical protein n=1 Tax=Bdellovibrio sp. HCB337 TaxID=3394358 RepID=UPI0039A4A2D3
MSKGKLYALTVMGVFAVLQLCAAISEKEMFPLSPFAMYSRLYDAQDLRILRITCAKPPMPKERFISEFDLFRPEGDYISDLGDFLYSDLPLSEPGRQFAATILAPLHEYLKDQCASLKVYRYTWKQFTGQKRFKPDQKELIFETSL